MSSNRTPIGRYPTPVFRADALCTPGAEIWVKDDGLTNRVYGGNKVRKLERLLAEAARRRARRILTVGAVGSHHVLGTTVFAREQGLRVAAVLFPQPLTDDVRDTFRASMSHGLEAHFSRSLALAPVRIAMLLRPGDYFVPAGGSNVLGTLSYVDATAELVSQIRQNELPEPDFIVVALGSGGTAAGLLAGVLREGLASRVVGVQVVDSILTSAGLVVGLAVLAGRRVGAPIDPLRARRSLMIDGAELGKGYGWPTASGRAATVRAAAAGLTLDPTYTGKAFAAVLRIAVEPRANRNFLQTPGSVPNNRPVRLLYWHTLSSAPMDPLLADAPSLENLPRAFRKLRVSADFW